MRERQVVLFEAFECGGRWWLPDAPETVVGGSLKYSRDELSVRLDGTLGSVSVEQMGVLASDFRRFDRLHGVLDDGQKCTLFRAFVTAFTGSWMVCSGIYLVVGYHLEGLDQLRFDGVSASPSKLDEFLDRNVFAVQATDAVDQATLTYTKPERQVFAISSISARFEIDSTFRLKGDRNMAEAIAGSHFNIIPDSPQPLEWFQKTLWRLCDLLTLLTDEPCHACWIRVTPNGDPCDGPLLYTSSGPHRERDALRSSVLLFYFSQLADRLGPILEKWFSASDVLLSAIYLFRDAHRSADPSNRGRFLILSQALEAFSRATMPGAYMADGDYERVKNALVAAIPSEVGEDHRASLKNRIKYGNEHSLRKRLSGLLGSMGPQMVACVCASASDFTSGIVDTRHYFTHLTDELRPKALSGIPLAWACDKLQMLLRLLLLRWVGVDEQLIVARVTHHPRLAQYIYLGNRQRECIKTPTQNTN
ncbi:MAG TPA: HEPN domain-containing protein [Pirellulales bacterium]|nr:HEPN domain-containing protein [Pirellulales bacterium]